jgi:hypothetical protein
MSYTKLLGLREEISDWKIAKLIQSANEQEIIIGGVIIRKPNINQNGTV